METATRVLLCLRGECHGIVHLSVMKMRGEQATGQIEMKEKRNGEPSTSRVVIICTEREWAGTGKSSNPSVAAASRFKSRSLGQRLKIQCPCNEELPDLAAICRRLWPLGRVLRRPDATLVSALRVQVREVRSAHVLDLIAVPVRVPVVLLLTTGHRLVESKTGQVLLLLLLLLCGCIDRSVAGHLKGSRTAGFHGRTAQALGLQLHTLTIPFEVIGFQPRFKGQRVESGRIGAAGVTFGPFRFLARATAA